MRQRRFRLGIRAQLTIVVLLAAVLSTGATLFIANNAIQTYALQQASNQEQQHMAIAQLVLKTQYGQNISISSNGKLVADSPTISKDLSGYAAPGQSYGQYPLDGDVDYVDQVQQLIGGFVSIYKCASVTNQLNLCSRIATTFTAPGASPSASTSSSRDTGQLLESVPASTMNLGAKNSNFLGQVTLRGDQYYADYAPLYNPQQQVIGVLAVGVPLDSVTAFQQSTTVELLLLGAIVMIAGIIFALLFASSIISTLQNVARQVSFASQRIGAIATQQVGGAEQQVWAVGSINKALQNFAETTRDISHRTDQLAQMGDQIIRRRVDILPQQIDTILAYITRSVRDISSASRQESQQYERMTGAMQAVMEIAEQVSSGSQQATDSARHLDEAVLELQQIVGVRAIHAATSQTMDINDFPSEAMLAGAGALPQSQPAMGYGNGSSGAMGLNNGMAAYGRGSSGQMGIRNDRGMGMGMRMGGGNMGRMPDTAATLGGALPAGVMGGPMQGRQSDALRNGGGQNGGQYGGQYGAQYGGQYGGQNGGQYGAQYGGQYGQMAPMSSGYAGRMPGIPASGPIGPANGAPGMGQMPPIGTGGQLPPLGGPMDMGGYAGRMSFGGDGRSGPDDYGAAMPPLPDYPAALPQGQGYQGSNIAPPGGRTRGVRGPLGQRSSGNTGAHGGAQLPEWLTEEDESGR
jgi:hypothetical protein